jgi:hypothetical protein
MPQVGKENSRHHYVQRAYLERFSADGRIDVIDRVTGIARYGQLVSSVATVRGFYSYETRSGDKDGSLEDVLEKNIETPANEIIKRLTNSPAQLTDEEKVVLANYIALQLSRTLESKRMFELNFSLSADIEIFNLANDGEIIREKLKAKGEDSSDSAVASMQARLLDFDKNPEILPPRNLWLKYMLEGQEQMAQIIVERYTSWHLAIFDEPSLITGDHPVIVRKIYDDHRGTGVANADEIIFPISTTVVLMLTSHTDLPEQVMYGTDKSVAIMINDIIKAGSYLEYYCPPALTERYVGDPLGKRTLLHMEGGENPGLEFLRKYSEPLKRERPIR